MGRKDTREFDHKTYRHGRILEFTVKYMFDVSFSPLTTDYNVCAQTNFRYLIIWKGSSLIIQTGDLIGWINARESVSKLIIPTEDFKVCSVLFN